MARINILHMFTGVLLPPTSLPSAWPPLYWAMISFSFVVFLTSYVSSWLILKIENFWYRGTDCVFSSSKLLKPVSLSNAHFLSLS